MSKRNARNGLEPRGTTASAILDVNGLSVEFATAAGWTRVVDDVSFSVAAGTTVGLVGESGSGKTVTSLAVMGLLPKRGSRIASGTVRLDGTDVLGLSERQLQNVRGAEMAMIFQEPMTSLNPAFTVGDQIRETVQRHLPLSRKQAKEKAIDALGRVGIPDPRSRYDAYPHQFSGGMRQRVMIAIAISCDPRLVIADEPTTALDVTIQTQVLDLLQTMVADLQIGLLLITHDLGVVAEICDEVVVMYGGQVVCKDPVHELFAHPSHPYAEGLMLAMPQIDAGTPDLLTIPGVPVSPGNLPSGCRFQPRCPYATAECLEPVELISISPRRAVRCVRHEDLELIAPSG